MKPPDELEVLLNDAVAGVPENPEKLKLAALLLVLEFAARLAKLTLDVNRGDSVVVDVVDEPNNVPPSGCGLRIEFEPNTDTGAAILKNRNFSMAFDIRPSIIHTLFGIDGLICSCCS